MKKKRITFEIDAKLHKKFRLEAKKKDRTITGELREYIRDVCSD